MAPDSPSHSNYFSVRCSHGCIVTGRGGYALLCCVIRYCLYVTRSTPFRFLITGKRGLTLCVAGFIVMSKSEPLGSR